MDFYRQPRFQQKIKVDTASDCIWSTTWCQGQLLSGSVDGCVRYWDFSKKDANEPVFTTAKRKIGITSIVALSDGSMAIACFQDGTIRFYDLFAQEEREQSRIHAGLLEAYSLSLSPQEDLLVSGNARGGIHFWSMESDAHERVGTLETDAKQIISTDINFDAKLVSSSMDGIVHVHDLKTQQLAYRLQDHFMPVRSVTFSEDGNLFFSASDDRSLRAYDMRTGRHIMEFNHESRAMSCAASPDGRTVVTGSSDGSVCVWDLGLRRRVDRFEAHHDAVWSVSFNNLDGDGHTFASGAEDGTICLFQRDAGN
jgi:WD repeat-containing protein 61|eukprot:gene5273-3766_t